ncbi:iron-siderophore ABC transporter permease protein [Bacillus sp. TS-2]|nr:iron-siderophore ABC transporter permease protein [Bacillus sp. TS-2]
MILEGWFIWKENLIEHVMWGYDYQGSDDEEITKKTGIFLITVGLGIILISILTHIIGVNKIIWLVFLTPVFTIAIVYRINLLTKL